jgi:hypothetical protein
MLAAVLVEIERDAVSHVEAFTAIIYFWCCTTACNQFTAS